MAYPASAARATGPLIQLRTWQREAFGVYRDALNRSERSILWEATPGAGKTTAALAVCLHQVRRLRAPTVLVVVPTAHLKLQWARAAGKLGLNLDSTLSKDGAPRARDVHGYVVTYQQVAQDPQFFRTIARHSCTVLDEIHHAGDGLSWGDAIQFSLAEARFVLCLSGTPFRSDNSAIPFVRYDNLGMSSADYSYGYARAVEDGVCRPTAFLTYGGAVSWREHDVEITASFSDSLDPLGSARRLRVAVSAESGWLKPVFRDAHRLLMTARQHTPSAGGLVVASSQTQARKLGRELATITGTRPVIVLSEDSSASENLKRFQDSGEPWLIACNMVSEGVDIPRLQVGIYATTIRTKMYFRQFIGRLVRSRPTGHSPSPLSNVAFCYLPADPTLQQLAYDIETEIRHCTKSQDTESLLDSLTAPRERLDPPEQTWDILESTNDGLQSLIVHGTRVSGDQVATLDDFHATHEVQNLVHEQVSERLTQKRAPAELKAALTREIRRLVALCHRRLNCSHAAIYAQLNAEQGIQSQNSCSETQLRHRITLLNNMLAPPPRPRVSEG